MLSCTLVGRLCVVPSPTARHSEAEGGLRTQAPAEPDAEEIDRVIRGPGGSRGARPICDCKYSNWTRKIQNFWS